MLTVFAVSKAICI